MAANKIGKVLNAAKKLKPKGEKTVVGCGQGSSASAAYVHRDEERLLRRAARVQRQVENRMLDLPGVVGIGVTLDERRRPVIMLLLESENEETRHAIPAEIDGLVTDVRVTGPFLAN